MRIIALTSMISCIAFTLWSGAARAEWDTHLGFRAAIARSSRTATPPSAAGGRPQDARQVDFGSVPDGAGLALLAVGAVPDLVGLKRFVAEGGRLLLAVEGAADAPTLAAFGLRPVEVPPSAERLGGHEALAVLRVSEGAGRYGRLGALVTNRAVALRATEWAPALGWPGGDGLVYALRLGAGEVLVVGDASLFIDLMRPVAGNAAFADSAAAWLGEGGRPVLVAVGDGALRGLRDPRPPTPPLAARVNTALESLRTQGPPAGLTARALAAALGFLVAWVALRRLPGGGRAPRPSRPPGDRTQGLAGQPGGPGAPRDETGALGNPGGSSIAGGLGVRAVPTAAPPARAQSRSLRTSSDERADP